MRARVLYACIHVNGVSVHTCYCYMLHERSSWDMLRELGVLFVFCLSACKQRGGKVLRANAIAARASSKLFQLMACKYDCCTCKHLLLSVKPK